MSIPIVLAYIVSACTVVAHVAYWLPSHKAYGLYAIALALATVHCISVGRWGWAAIPTMLAVVFAALWWRGGGRAYLRRRADARATGSDRA